VVFFHRPATTPWRPTTAAPALVRAFMDWARARGAQWLTVSAFAANERAIVFYRRAGFAPHSLTLEYYIQ